MYLMRQPICSTSSGGTLVILKHSLNRGESTCCTFVLYFLFDGYISIRTYKINYHWHGKLLFLTVGKIVTIKRWKMLKQFFLKYVLWYLQTYLKNLAGQIMDFLIIINARISLSGHSDLSRFHWLILKFRWPLNIF